MATSRSSPPNRNMSWELKMPHQYIKLPIQESLACAAVDPEKGREGLSTWSIIKWHCIPTNAVMVAFISSSISEY